MKIDERVSSYMALLNSEAPKAAAQTGDASGSAAVEKKSPVEVDISSTALQLADDEARRERLNLIRQQLSEGTYSISGKDVADKILNVLKG